MGRVLLLSCLFSSLAWAQPADEFPVATPGALYVQGGFVTGFPAALSTGLGRGVGAAASLGTGPARFGVRAAWLTASESSMAWEVTHQDVQLRVTAGLEHLAGRGRIGLRLGAGGDLIHETRLRAQGERAGLEGDELEMTALSLAPAFDLEVTVGVAVIGAWGIAIAGGPTLVVIDGEAKGSWVATVGVGWTR